AIGYSPPEFGICEMRIGVGLQMAVYVNVKLSRAVTSFNPEGSFALDGDLNEAAFGYNVGLQYEPMEEVTLGFTYSSKVKTEFEGDANFHSLPVGFPSESTRSEERRGGKASR